MRMQMWTATSEKSNLNGGDEISLLAVVQK